MHATYQRDLVPEPHLPSHVEETLRAIRKLKSDHDSAATPLQRSLAYLTGLFAMPAFLGFLSVFVFIWLFGNWLCVRLDYAMFDPPPFALLQGLLTLITMFMTTLILGTQRRDDAMARHREELTLQLAIVGEQKNAKIIALLEELRRDHPQIPDRVDDVAATMATPTDTAIISDAIKDS